MPRYDRNIDDVKIKPTKKGSEYKFYFVKKITISVISHLVYKPEKG